MPKRKPAGDNLRGLALCGAGDIATTERYRDYALTEVPGGDLSSNSAKNTAIAKAKRLADSNYWLKSFLRLKTTVTNYGLIFNPGRPRRNGKVLKRDRTTEDEEALDAWFDGLVDKPTVEGDKDNLNIGVPGQSDQTRREQILGLIKHTISDFILLDSVIASWGEMQNFPVLLDHSRCRYRDVLGIETIFYNHGLSLTDISLLNAEQQKLFKKPEVPIDPADGNYFKVLKRSQPGYGFPWPSIQSIFRTLGTMESMELGESSYAYAGRLKFRQHVVGHEITQGLHAGKSTHFVSKKRADAIKKTSENKVGFGGDMVTNFDHEIKYPHEDEKYFDEKKWSSPEHRLVKWGGPLAELMMGGDAAFLSSFVRAEILDLRDDLKMFLESVINQAWPDAPTTISLEWSNLIFNSAQLLADSAEFGVSCGAISQSTWREVTGFNDKREEAKKETEAKGVKANKEKFMPAYDPAHGDPTADSGGGPAGRAHKDKK